MYYKPRYEGITFDDVLLVPQYNTLVSRRLTDISMTDRSKKVSLQLPIFTANMDTITESNMANWIGEKGGTGVLHRFMSIDNNLEEYCKSHKDTFASVGTSEDEVKRFRELYRVGCRKFCIDVAHGHAGYIINMIKIMRTEHPEICIMAGNVATREAAQDLYVAGADLIKVGIGPGSVCTTRIKTGFGVPQLSAIVDCTDRATEKRWSVVADGGLRTPGDIVKALAFGADFVMIGGMLAGTHYTPGEIFDEGMKGPFVKKYRGMASKEVAEDYNGGLSEWKTAEGVATTVPYKTQEESEFLIHDIIGGLRSGLTYAGASNIKELQERMQWIKISGATQIENQPHKKLGS